MQEVTNEKNFRGPHGAPHQVKRPGVTAPGRSNTVLSSNTWRVAPHRFILSVGRPPFDRNENENKGLVHMSSVSWLNREFNIHSHDAQWGDVAGIYVFAGRNVEGKWFPTYIGQTNSFKDRILSHERWEEAKRSGATHVHARVVLQQVDRDKIEKEMIETWKPKLNTHHK